MTEVIFPIKKTQTIEQSTFWLEWDPTNTPLTAGSITPAVCVARATKEFVQIIQPFLLSIKMSFTLEGHFYEWSALG